MVGTGLIAGIADFDSIGVVVAGCMDFAYRMDCDELYCMDSAAGSIADNSEVDTNSTSGVVAVQFAACSSSGGMHQTIISCQLLHQHSDRWSGSPPDFALTSPLCVCPVT